jgi:hypothetical protein
MRKNKPKEKSKNLHLALYFGLVVFFIIIVSFSIKVLDTIKRSKFDGNAYAIAIIENKDSQIISVSPKDGTLKKLTIKGASSEDSLKKAGIPFDSVATSKQNISLGPKSYFTKILFHKDGFKSNVTMVDLVKLSFYSEKVGGDNITEKSVSLTDSVVLSNLLEEWFNDPQIVKEDLNISVTNTTQTSGLGNKYAKIVTSVGGNVVLVNNSQNEEKKSKIFYKEDSYTAKKLSKLLGIPAEKKEVNAISDIVIQIGKDKENF